MGQLRALFRVGGRASAPARLALGAGAVVILLAVWSALTYSGAVQPVVLPTPTAVLKAAGELLTPAEGKGFFQAPLINHTLVSLGRTLKALLISALIAIPLGVLMGSFPFFDGLFGPPVSAVKAIPATAFIGLLSVIYGIDEQMKVVFLVLGAVFFMILMVRDAVQGVRESYVRTAVDIGVSGPQLIWHVLVPGALPVIWESLIICNGIMWTYIVIAAYVNAQAGLGALIQQSSKVFDTGRIYVGIVTIALVAVGTDALLRWLGRQWFPWRDK